MNIKGRAIAVLLGGLVLGLAGCSTPADRTATVQTTQLDTTALPPNTTAADTASADATADALGREAGASLQYEQNTISVVERFEPGLVYITTEQQAAAQNPFGMMGEEAQAQSGVGSGFFVNDAGDILTNYHVVAGEGGVARPAASPSG